MVSVVIMEEQKQHISEVLGWMIIQSRKIKNKEKDTDLDIKKIYLLGIIQEQDFCRGIYYGVIQRVVKKIYQVIREDLS